MVVTGILLLVAAAQAFGLFGSGSPSILSPDPLPLVVLWSVGLPPFVTIAAVPIAFWAFSHHLFSGAALVPYRSIALAVLVALLSAVWFVAAWRGGLRYEGRMYTAATAALSAMLALTVLLLLATARRRSSWSLALAGHGILFLWMFTYAFAYLGETP